MTTIISKKPKVQILIESKNSHNNRNGYNWCSFHHFIPLHHSNSNQKMNRKVKFFGTAIGIFVCYFYYGILQESITKGKYILPDGTKETFTYTLSLVAVQCVVNYVYALITLKTISPMKSSHGRVDNKLFAVCSLTYLLAMITSNMSLRWVSYPTQVIGKSCKPIPVMLLGVLVGGRSYAFKKYMFILVIVVGVALFMYNPKKAGSSSSSSAGGIGIGEMMLIMSLAMDGLTGAVQERMRASDTKPNSSYMMKMMNLFSIMYAGIGLVFTGELFDFVSFIQRHPFIVYEMLTFSIASALGQFFIYVMVCDFGPLPCSIVTTTRKFFTVLASVVYFGNTLSSLQWIGTVAVFSGLALDSIYGGK